MSCPAHAAVLPVLAILVLGSEFVAIYALSTLGKRKHREASHPRIMQGPAPTATLFTLEALYFRRPEAGR